MILYQQGVLKRKYRVLRQRGTARLQRRKGDIEKVWGKTAEVFHSARKKECENAHLADYVGASEGERRKENSSRGKNGLKRKTRRRGKSTTMGASAALLKTRRKIPSPADGNNYRQRGGGDDARRKLKKGILPSAPEVLRRAR